MKYVYLIKSIPFPRQKYTGITSDVPKRLSDHNSGKSVHTAKYKPWKLIAYIAFTEDKKAAEFERYLKSGSGRAFVKKRLWDNTIE